MTEPAGERFAVVLAPGERPSFEIIEQATAILARGAGLTFADARRIAQAWPGILIRDLDPAQAEGIAAELSALGIELSTVAEAELPDIGAAVPIYRLGFEHDGLQPNPGATVALDVVKWDEVAAICVGSVAKYQDKVSDDWTPGPAYVVPVACGVGVAPNTPRREVRLVPQVMVDLVARGPLRRMRIRSDEFSFRCLGDKMTPSRPRNFALLVEQLVASAPAAQHNLALAEGHHGSLNRRWEQFHSLADFESRVQWLLYQSEHIVDAQEGPAELPAPGD